MDDEHPGEIWNRDLIPPQAPFVSISDDGRSYYDPDTKALVVQDPRQKTAPFVALHETAHASLDYEGARRSSLQTELDANYRVVLQLKAIGGWPGTYREDMKASLISYLTAYDNKDSIADKLIAKLEKEADHDLRTSRLYNR